MYRHVKDIVFLSELLNVILIKYIYDDDDDDDDSKRAVAAVTYVKRYVVFVYVKPLAGVG